ncbi:hypothetical protein [Rathayibacter toxicus]|uniref:hypothetical protein n=1 Tax=Rathayibacter toxicus TaxID=145458 RepID=UPI0011B03A0B|nr:hypothetical protein [Rathayibacter toxicus]QOD10371.1 hypothetical protein BSG36_10820 [Rathayibacter toxicus]QWL29043.1 hypothetical protein E2R33_10830 [Rathayibacter toxicus]QWL30587.1 hypothetical protein E2R34_07485 [Rathayibacter toxicus]QWL32687.1 hypothetical protein E2R35_07570 [Rathayibacter toxicus]QWL34782.1 hypothetical protein E2R36_07575 [Rathayibacter toxicus]
MSNYLDKGVALFDWMEPSTDLLKERFTTSAGRGMKTDGRFYWRADAGSYVRNYNVAVHDELLEHIRSSPQHGTKFSPTQLDEMTRFLQSVVYGGCAYPFISPHKKTSIPHHQLIEESEIIQSIGTLSRPELFESNLYPFMGQIRTSERDAIADYLDRGIMIFGWMCSDKSIFGQFNGSSGGMLTDGQYYWRDDAGDYVRALGIGIPAPALRSMKKLEGQPFTISKDSLLRKEQFYFQTIP